MTFTSNQQKRIQTVFFYEAGTKNLKYTFMHTMNYKGNPDTISVIDPKLKYDVVANTLPRVETKNVSIIRGRHNYINLDCPQGMLSVRIKGPSSRPNVKVIVRQNDQAITLNVQEIKEIQRYIVGTYDLEILTLPRIYQDNVSIDQSVYKYIDIPGSGQLKYQAYNPIVGQIFLKTESGDLVWVCDLDSEKSIDYIHLQPGNYKVVYRNKTATSTDYTLYKDFQIISGDKVSLKL